LFCPEYRLTGATFFSIGFSGAFQKKRVKKCIEYVIVSEKLINTDINVYLGAHCIQKHF